MAACSRPLAGLRRAARGAHICENSLLTNDTAMCCECCNMYFEYRKNVI